jgi:hypothetical protein
LAWLAATAVVWAEPGRARLLLLRPAQSTCPTAEDVQADVEALLGRAIFTSESAGAVEVRCDIMEHQSGSLARIDVRAPDGSALGTRELSAGPGECAALRRPLALVLVMLLDSQQPTPEAPPAPAPRRKLQGALNAFAGVLVGALPRATGGLGLGLGPRLSPRLDLRFDAAYWLPVTAETQQGTGAKFHGVTLGGAACPAWPWGAGPLRLALCGGAQAVLLVAVPHQVSGRTRELGAYGQGYLTVNLQARWAGYLLEAALGPTLAFTRPEFFLVESDGSKLEVQRPARWGAIFRLGLIIPAP